MQKMKVISDIWTLRLSLISKVYTHNTKIFCAIKVSLLQDSWTLLVILSPFRLFQIWFISIVTQNHYGITLVHGKWTVVSVKCCHTVDSIIRTTMACFNTKIKDCWIQIHFYYRTLRKNQILLAGNNIFFIRVLTVIYLPYFYGTSHFLTCISVIHKHIFTKVSWEQDLCLVYLCITIRTQ